MARGRPPKSPDERRVQISIRVMPDTLAQLERAAVGSGVTLSEEISTRLARSFVARQGQVNEFGGYVSHAFARLLVQALEILRRDTGHAWFRNRFTYDHAVEAAIELLRYFRPRGRRSVPSDMPVLEKVRSAGLDTASVAAHAKNFPYGKVAARMAVFRLEVADDKFGDEDEPEDIRRERQLFAHLGEDLRRLLASEGQAQRDLIDWGDNQ